MLANMDELERATFAENIPALLEALTACSRQTMVETPGWVTRKSRELLVELLRNKPVNDIRPAERHRERCRRNILHSLRHEYVCDVLQQQTIIPQQIAELEADLDHGGWTDADSIKRAKQYLRERREYRTAIGDDLRSACEAVSRLLLDEGDVSATPENVRRSFDLVSSGSEGSFYVSSNSRLLHALDLDPPWRASLNGNFEKALLGKRYERLRLPDRHHGPKEPATKKQPSIKRSTTLPTPSPEPADPTDPLQRLEFAVASGNVVAVVSALHIWNRAGGLAPAWLLKRAASIIVELWRRKAKPGRLSNPLTRCKQLLLDCERYLYISRKAQARELLSTIVEGAYRHAGCSTREIAAGLRARGLLHSRGLDAAIRETLLDLAGTPLDTSFEAAKRAFQRIRKSPHLLKMHWVPPDEVAKELGLPALSQLQKVGTKSPQSVQATRA